MILKPFLTNNRLQRIWKLAQVDFRKRYYNNNLGVLWALINPIFKVGVYYLVFTNVFKVKEDNYGFFIFSGIIIWNVFSEASTRGMGIARQKLYLIENIQFKWIDIFHSFNLSIFIGFSFNLIAFILLQLIFGQLPDLELFLLPILFAQLYLILLGLTLILATLQPFFKDLVHLWDMVLLVGFWSSGIFFNTESILNFFPTAIYLNPFIGIISNGRAILMSSSEINYTYLMVNTLQVIPIFLLGKIIFKKNFPIAIEKL